MKHFTNDENESTWRFGPMLSKLLIWLLEPQNPVKFFILSVWIANESINNKWTKKWALVLSIFGVVQKFDPFSYLSFCKKPVQKLHNILPKQ